MVASTSLVLAAVPAGVATCVKVSHRAKSTANSHSLFIFDLDDTLTIKGVASEATIKLLKELRKRGQRMAIASFNNDAPGFLRKNGIEDLFDTISWGKGVNISKVHHVTAVLHHAKHPGAVYFFDDLQVNVEQVGARFPWIACLHVSNTESLQPIIERIMRCRSGGPTLRVVEAGNTVELMMLPEGKEISVGRDNSNALRIADTSCSRKHAVLQAFSAQQGGWSVFIVDAESTIGTFVDGRKTQHNANIPLQAGTTLRFGAYVRTYILEGMGNANGLPLPEKMPKFVIGRQQSTQMQLQQQKQQTARVDIDMDQTMDSGSLTERDEKDLNSEGLEVKENITNRKQEADEKQLNLIPKNNQRSIQSRQQYAQHQRQKSFTTPNRQQPQPQLRQSPRLPLATLQQQQQSHSKAQQQAAILFAKQPIQRNQQTSQQPLQQQPLRSIPRQPSTLQPPFFSQTPRQPLIAQHTRSKSPAIGVDALRAHDGRSSPALSARRSLKKSNSSNALNPNNVSLYASSNGNNATRPVSASILNRGNRKEEGESCHAAAMQQQYSSISSRLVAC